MNTLEGKSRIEYLRETCERGRQLSGGSDIEEETISINLVIDIETLMTINDLLKIQNNGHSYIKRVLKKEVTLSGFIYEAINKEIERNIINNLLYSGFNNFKLKNSNNEIKNCFKEMINKLQIKQTELSEITGISNSKLSLILNNEHPISMEDFLSIWDAVGHPPIEECFK